MIKKIIILVLTSSLISAGLLFLGITMMGQYTPALASSLNALVARTSVQKSLNAIPVMGGDPLAMDPGGEKEKPQVLSESNFPDLASSLNAPVAGTNVQNSPNAFPAVGGVPQRMDPGGVKQKLEASSTSISVSPTPVGSSQPLKVPVNSVSATTPVTGITIAQLINSPEKLIDKVFIITGIATSLSNDKFLLNDGTGQILVEIGDDHLVSIAVLNSMTVTVTGKLDDSSNQSSFHLDAYTLTAQNGTVLFDDSKDDDSSLGDHDCSNDNCSDDCSNDDCSNDCKNDNCSDDSDDDSGDDSDDDSGDDSGDDGDDD